MIFYHSELQKWEVTDVRKGFTLIELVVTIALVLILASTLGPKLRRVIRSSRDSRAVAAVSAYRTASNVYCIENNGIGGFQDILHKSSLGVNDKAAQNLYSSYYGSSYKGQYYSGDATGNLGFLEVGTNTSGQTIDGKPAISVGMEVNTGEVVIIEDPFNERDTKSREWYKY